MNEYAQNIQDIKTQAENKKKKDDTITKGILLAGAIVGGIALYNATVNNNVPKTTLNSLFDNKLSPNSIENGNTPVVPPVVEPNLETTNIVDKGTQQMNNIIGINIASDSSDELGRLLTNPGNNLSMYYNDKLYRNAEHAYQTWKSGQFDEVAYNSTAFKPKGSLSVNKELSAGIMEDILTNKLMQHPELVKQIDDRGGLDFIKASTHKVGNTSDYWTNGGFINALGNAYVTAKKYPTPTKTAPTVEIPKDLGTQQMQDLIIHQNWKDIDAYANSIGGINTLRKASGNHFGNPFSPNEHSYASIKVNSIKDSVDAFDKWITKQDYLDVEPERRDWIREQIINGSLKGKPLVYYTNEVPDNSYNTKFYDYNSAPNHAHRLQYYINNGLPEVGKVIPYEGEYSIDFARQHPNDLIIFGDNTRSRLYTHDNVSKTQAVIRNEPNAIGLDTKRDMFENPNSYFTDDVLENPEFKRYVNETTATLLNALKSGKNVIVHKRIGLGKAQLDKRAPKLLAFYRNLFNNLYKNFH